MILKDELVGNCRTTAMGILPHRSLEKALQLALSLDIPFWPQLPRMSFFEDMYVQVSEHFPGMMVDEEEKEIRLSPEGFYEGLPEYLEHADDPGYFRLSPKYSLVYNAFLKEDLSRYALIRGQSIGPVSYGLKITDPDKRPIIYDDEVRAFLFEFIAKKIETQYQELVKHNPRAFVWIDEPGLELIFMSFSGYGSERAREDYAAFLETLTGPKGVHLCANPDWSFLLGLDLDILSVDALAWGEIFTRYTGEIKNFLDRGGIISWGITPTLDEEVTGVSADQMVDRLESLWEHLVAKGITKEQILAQAWLAPARCCLINPDETGVERSFAILKEVARKLKEKYGI